MSFFGKGVGMGTGKKARGEGREAKAGAKAHGRAEEPQARGTGDNFAFIVDGKRPQITDREMIVSLKAYARKVHGRQFSGREFNAWPKRRCAGNTIAHRFGTWSRALQAAGVERPRCSPYSTEALMQSLETLWRKLGRAPGEEAIRKYGMAPKTYVRRWGSLHRACELLAAHKRGELSRADLLRGGIREYREPLKP